MAYNPANYQSGGAAFVFTAAPTATSVQFYYQADTAANPFAVSDASLEEEILGYTLTRKTYFLSGTVV